MLFIVHTSIVFRKSQIASFSIFLLHFHTICWQSKVSDMFSVIGILSTKRGDVAYKERCERQSCINRAGQSMHTTKNNLEFIYIFFPELPRKFKLSVLAKLNEPVFKSRMMLMML